MEEGRLELTSLTEHHPVVSVEGGASRTELLRRGILSRRLLEAARAARHLSLQDQVVRRVRQEREQASHVLGLGLSLARLARPDLNAQPALLEAPLEVARLQALPRALGPQQTVEPETLILDVLPDDLLVLCSDGLCGPASDEEIEEIVTTQSDLKTASSKLIEKANSNGGPDNITVILAKVMGVG